MWDFVIGGKGRWVGGSEEEEPSASEVAAGIVMELSDSFKKEFDAGIRLRNG